MSLTEIEILGWTRIFTLLLGMGWAAWMDHKERRVQNEHWLVWVKPALFLWALELMYHGADWTIYLTASAAVAYASGAVLGRPTLSDIKAGSRMDQSVAMSQSKLEELYEDPNIPPEFGTLILMINTELEKILVEVL